MVIKIMHFQNGVNALIKLNGMIYSTWGYIMLHQLVK